MSLKVKFRSKTARTDQFLVKHRELVQLVIDKVTADIEADYKAGVGVRSSALKNSIDSEPVRPLLNRVFSPLNYAYWHEIGSRSFPGNPALRRAVEQHRAAFREAMRRIYRKA